MTKYCACLVSVLLFMAPSVAIGAEKITKTISADQTSHVWSVAIYNRHSCRGRATPTLGRWSAEHGTLTTKKVKHGVEEGERCAGNTFYYLSVFYTPKDGFRGTDTVNFSVVTPRWDGSHQKKSWRYKADLTIK